MATINNFSQFSKFSTKTDVSKLNSSKLENSTEVSDESVSVSATKTFEDSFSFKSDSTFGGYSKESLTNSSVQEDLVEDTLVDEETAEESKGMDISKLTGGNSSSSSFKIDVSEMKNQQLVNFSNMIQKMINGLADEDGKIPTRVQQAAAASLEGDGYWSPESVSGRILDMAKALSGGDPDKFELLKEAVIKGFGAAADEWGDDLPEITNVTFDLVMKGFDDWYKELNPSAE